jgi:hypothetical protein
MRARFYSPAIGRFLQTDPSGYGSGNNLYAYVGNDPLNLIDPTGLFSEGFGQGFSEGSTGTNNSFYELMASGSTANEVGGVTGFAAGVLEQIGTEAIAGTVGVGVAGRFGGAAAAAGADLTAGSIPLGFESAGQFNEAVTGLQSALSESGITDATIGVRGSSVTGTSFRTGLPFGPESDIDFFAESQQLTQGLKTSSNIPGLVYPRTIANNYPAVSNWAQTWSQTLGRTVSVGGFQLGTVPPGPMILP